MIRKCHKYIEYTTTKFKIFLKQRTFASGDYELKYLLEEIESDTLVVVFSACTRPGVKARYNYNRTLKNINANKLFILDDFGYDSRGAFYLGANNDYKIQECVRRLISYIINRNNIKKIIFIGSSKGGFAALNFGLEWKDSAIIIGAPQYYLGDWLNSPANQETLNYIVGSITSEKVEYLNRMLPNKLEKCRENNSKIYLHYSTEEHTYKEHIQYLLEDIKSYGYAYEVDEKDYIDHGKVSLYFPPYLVKTLLKIMNEKNIY